MSPARLIAQLSGAAASTPVARESITVGRVTFWADFGEIVDGETWFHHPGHSVAFCRDGDGWHCAIGKPSGRGATPQEAFGVALQALTTELLAMVGEESAQ